MVEGRLRKFYSDMDDHSYSVTDKQLIINNEKFKIGFSDSDSYNFINLSDDNRSYTFKKIKSW